MTKGVLYRTRVYLAGNIENSANSDWRERITKQLNKLGIICLNPTKQVFTDQVLETEDTRSDLLFYRSEGDYKVVHDFMKSVIQKDLRQIDISDFVIINLEIDKPTFGTIHELVLNSSQRKPLLILVKDKTKMPLWLIGLINMDYVWEREDDLINYLTNVNSGTYRLDSKYWKLLIPSLR